MKTKKYVFITVFVLLAVITGIIIGWLLMRSGSTTPSDRSEQDETAYDTVYLDGIYAELNFDSVIDEVDVVVKGTVTQKGQTYMPDLSIPQKYAPPDNVPLTDYTINVTKVYKGAPAQDITVRVQGGIYDGIEYKLDRDPNLQVGKEYILLLREGDMYVKSPDDLHYEIKHTSAGCFEVADDGSIVNNNLIKGDFNHFLNFLNVI